MTFRAVTLLAIVINFYRPPRACTTSAPSCVL